MAVIKTIGLFLSAVLSRLVADDFRAWMPLMTRRLVKYAVAMLPLDKRQRYEEEWHSHVNEVPGELGRLLACLGFLAAARKMALAPRNRQARTTVYDVLRRAGDMGIGGLAFVYFLPAFSAFYLVTHLTHNGPILVSREMVGLRGRKFNLLTLNTAGPFGRFLQRTKFNLLPNLINLMRGDVSIIGPRAYPPRAYELVSAKEPRWGARSAVRPGVLSWESEGGYSSWSEELEHDLYYIQNRGLKFDCTVVWHGLRATWLGFRQSFKRRDKSDTI